MYRSIILFVLLCSNAVAHEMTPTYPKWGITYIEGVKKATMKMVNKREDVEWYEIDVFDDKWKPIPFVTKSKIFKIKYLGHKKFDVYINAKDSERTEYLCSTSKLIGDGSTKPMLETRICSRFK
jgi:hypothetical protein